MPTPAPSLARSRWILVATALSLSVSWTPPIAHAAESPPPAALRYHNALQDRPEPGYLFDRFCREWMEAAPAESLETFLEERASSGESHDKLLLAFYYAREGRRVEAITKLRETIDKHPENALAWLTKAKLEAQTLDFDTAIQDLEHAAKLDAAPADVKEKINAERARLLIRLDRRDEALELMASMVRQRPADLTLREDLVYLQIEEGIFNHAIESLQDLIEATFDPSERIARKLWLAQIHRRAGDDAKALDVFEQTLSEVGSGTWLERETLSRIDDLFRLQDNLTGLATKLQELSETHAQRIEIHRARARVLLELDRTTEAIEVLQGLIERAPGDRELQLRLVESLVQGDRLEEAVRRLNAMITLAPNDQALRLQLADIHGRAGDADAAVEAIKATHQGPVDVSSLMRGVRVLERNNLNDEAVALVKAAADQNTEDEELQETLAETLARSGRTDEAMEAWLALVEESEDVTRALRAARAAARHGKASKADAALATRDAEFRADLAYLQARTELGAQAERWVESLPSALKWLERVRDPRMADRVVQATARAVSRAGQDQQTLARLQNQDALSTAERSLLAELLFDAGRVAEAEKTLLAADRSRRIEIQLIRLYRASSQDHRAAEVVTELLDRGDADPSLASMAVNLHARTGDTQAALSVVERWKTLAPASTAPWLRQARLMQDAGKPDAAIETLKAASRRFPQDDSASSALARLYQEEGRGTDAERVYWRLFESAETTTERVRWVRELSESAERYGRLKEVVRLLEDRTRTNRASIDPWLALAEANRVDGNYQAQRRALLEASRLDRNSIELTLALARLDEQWGDFDRAIQALRGVLDKDTSGRARGRLAGLLLRDRRTDEAVELFEADPNISVAELITFSNELMALGDWQTAGRVIQNVEDPVAAYLRAVALEEEGRATEAIEAFLTLAESDTESLRSPLLQQAQVDPWASMMAAEMDYLPEGTQLLTSLTYAGSRAYAYRRGNMGAFAMGFAGRSSSPMQTPSSPTELRNWSIIHATELGTLLDPDAQIALADRLQTAGVPAAELLVKTPLQSGYMQFQPALLEPYLDDPAVLAIYIGQAGIGVQASSHDILKRGIEEFNESHPLLALQARVALLAVQADEDERNQTWQELEQAVREIDEPKSAHVMLVTQLVQRQRYGMGTPLAPEQSQFLQETAAEWFPKLAPGDRTRSMAFSFILASQAAEEDWDRVAQLLVDEMRAHAANPQSSNQSIYAMYTGAMRGAQGIAPLNYPPPGITGVPESIATLFSGGGFMGAMGGSILDPAELLAALPQDTPPMLKALVAGAAEDTETFASIIDPMLTAENPSLDAYLMAAAKAVQSGESDKAIALLEKASFLPMSRSERERLDAAIVAEAFDGELSDASTEAARRSALRLRFSMTSPQLRQQLVMALDRLGLTEAAEEERERLTAQPANPGFNPSMLRQTAPAQTAATRAREMLRDGRKDDALRLILREGERAAQTLSSGNRWALQSGDWQGMMHLIRNEKLMNEIVEEARPAENASPAMQARFAMLLEVLDAKDEALRVYSTIGKDQLPPTTAARLPALYLSQGRTDDAVRTLRELQPMHVSMALSAMSDESRQRMFDPSAAVDDFPQLLVEYLESADKEALDAVQPMLLFGVIAQLAEQPPRNPQKRPNLYNKDLTLTATQQQAYGEDRKLHDQLARAMLRVPSTAQAGFSALLRTAEAAGEDLTPFKDLAAEALRVHAEATMQGAMFATSYASMHDSTVDRVPPRDPVSFYAQRADAEELTALLDELRSSGTPSLVREIEPVARLYLASDDEFVGAVRDRLKQSTMIPQQQDPLQSVIDAMLAREHDPNHLKPEIIAYTKRAGGNYAFAFRGMMGGSSPIQRYIIALIDTNGADAGAAFLEETAVELVGTPEQRELLIARFNPNRSVIGGAGGGVSAYMTILQSVASIPELVWDVCERLEPFSDEFSRYSLRNVHNELNQMLRSKVQDAAESEDLTDLKNFIKAAPFLADVTDFDPMSPGDEFSGTVLESFKASLAGTQNKTLKDEFASWLDGPLKDHFGAALTSVVLRSAPTDEAFAAIRPWRDEIINADEDQRARIAAALPGPLESAEDPELKEISEALFGAQRDVLKQLVAELILPSSLNIQRGIWEHQSRIHKVIPDLIAADERELTNELLTGVIALYDRSSVTLSRQGMGQDITPGSIFPWQTDDAPVWFIAEAMSSVERWKTPSLDDQSLYRFSGMFRKLVDTTEPADSTITDETLEERRMRTALEELAAHAVDVPMPVLVATLSKYADTNLSDTQRKRARAWSVERSAGEQPYWQHIRLAFIIADAQDATEPVTDIAEPHLLDAAIASAAENSPASLVVTWLGTTLAEFDVNVAFPRTESVALENAVQALEKHPESADASWLRPLIARVLARDALRQQIPPEELVELIVRAEQRTPNASPLIAAGKIWRHTEENSAPSTLGLMLLELALKADATDLVERLIRMNGRALQRDITCWTLLMAYDRHESAAEAIQTAWYDAVPSFPSDIFYSQSLAEHAKQTAALLDDAPLSYLAQLAADLRMDPAADDAASSASSREDRAIALAERFDSIPFTNDRQRALALTLLATSPSALTQLAPKLEAEAREADMSVQGRFGQAAFDSLTREIAHAALLAQAQRGEFELLNERTESLVLAGGTMGGSGHPELTELAALLPKIFETIPEGAIKDANSLRTSVNELASAGGRGWNGNQKIRAWNFVLYHLDGRSYSDWIDEMSKRNGRREDFAQLDADVVIEAFATAAGTQEQDDEKRLAALRALMEEPALQGAVDDHDNIFKGMVDANLLTKEELTRHALEFVELLGEEALLPLARDAYKLGAQELLPEAWERAVASRTSAEEKLHYLRHMIEDEQYTQALKHLQSLTDIPPDSLEQHERLLREAEAGTQQPQDPDAKHE